MLLRERPPGNIHLLEWSFLYLNEKHEMFSCPYYLKKEIVIMSNIELSNQTVIHNANIQSFGKIVNIVQQELDERNLEYLEFQNIDAQDKGRIVFDIQTLDQKAGKTYVVHVDFMHSAPGVYQFLDCVYGSGSASDLKYLIYDSSPMVDDEITHAKFYFVTRMINKCNAVGIPFKIIDYQNPLEKSNLVDHLSKENPDTVKQHIESGPLPSKWDILRMAFWSILYNTNSGNIYSELHQRFHLFLRHHTCFRSLTLFRL